MMFARVFSVFSSHAQRRKPGGCFFQGVFLSAGEDSLSICLIILYFFFFLLLLFCLFFILFFFFVFRSRLCFRGGLFFFFHRGHGRFPRSHKGYERDSKRYSALNKEVCYIRREQSDKYRRGYYDAEFCIFLIFRSVSLCSHRSFRCRMRRRQGLSSR